MYGIKYDCYYYNSYDERTTYQTFSEYEKLEDFEKAVKLLSEARTPFKCYRVELIKVLLEVKVVVSDV